MYKNNFVNDRLYKNYAYHLEGYFYEYYVEVFGKNKVIIKYNKW